MMERRFTSDLCEIKAGDMIEYLRLLQFTNFNNTGVILKLKICLTNLPS